MSVDPRCRSARSALSPKFSATCAAWPASPRAIVGAKARRRVTPCATHEASRRSATRAPTASSAKGPGASARLDVSSSRVAVARPSSITAHARATRAGSPSRASSSQPRTAVSTLRTSWTRAAPSSETAPGRGTTRESAGSAPDGAVGACSPSGCSTSLARIAHDTTSFDA
ncbi:MAG: hypothetical protein U0325_10815 [Polyangiales bacterium]